jgi:hypothetical protein
MQKKKKKHSFPRWLTLSLLENCFSDGEQTHLGIKFRGEYYCVTHSKANGIEIDKVYLKMKEISDKPEYFKKCQSEPKVLHRTQMKISEAFLVSFLLKLEEKKL